MAGVDQGATHLFDDMQFGTTDGVFPTYLTGISETGMGIGVGPSDTGRLEVLDMPLEFFQGLRTNTNRPTLVKPAGTGAGAGKVHDDTAGFDDVWWENVHILPRTKIDFGNIITQKQDTYELYSAFRDQAITLSSILNNASPGVTLPDESPPEVAEAQASMLGPTTTDNTSDSFVLGTMVLRDILAGADGLAVFDTSIDFTFSSGDMPQLFVSGSRIVLMPMEYEAPVKETLAFLTDIITALDGDEQRIALRKQPRQLFEVVYKLDANDRQRMQALLMDWTDNVFGFPLWDEKMTLTAAAGAGATQYSVAGADDVDLRVGGLAVVFTDANVFDVISITALTDTLITAGDPSINAYPVGTTIMPLRTARVLGAVPGQMHRNNLQEFKIAFEVTDNDTGALTGSTAAYSTYNGRVLFDGCNVMSDVMQEQYRRRLYRIDNSTGIVNVSSIWDRNKRSHQKGFVLRSRAETIDFRRVMLSLQGRVKAFYIPTFIEDVEVAAGLTVGLATMDIERIEYERFIQSREPKITMRITFTDGTNLVRIVQSATGVDATTERLTLDTTWPSSKTVDEIARVEFYELVRFDSDNVVINHPRIGLSECRMPVVQVFDDN